MGKSIFEQMGGTYTLGEDGMYYPGLVSQNHTPAVLPLRAKYCNA